MGQVRAEGGGVATPGSPRRFYADMDAPDSAYGMGGGRRYTNNSRRPAVRGYKRARGKVCRTSPL